MVFNPAGELPVQDFFWRITSAGSGGSFTGSAPDKSAGVDGLVVVEDLHLLQVMVLDTPSSCFPKSPSRWRNWWWWCWLLVVVAVAVLRAPGGAGGIIWWKWWTWITNVYAYGSPGPPVTYAGGGGGGGNTLHPVQMELVVLVVAAMETNTAFKELVDLEAIKTMAVVAVEDGNSGTYCWKGAGGSGIVVVRYQIGTVQTAKASGGAI